MVLFPEPEGPTIAVILPAGKVTFNPARTFMSGRVGYVKFTFSIVISSAAETSGALDPLVSRAGRSIIAKSRSAELADLAAAERGDAMVPIDMTIIMTDIKTLLLLVFEQPRVGCTYMMSAPTSGISKFM